MDDSITGKLIAMLLVGLVIGVAVGLRFAAGELAQCRDAGRPPDNSRGTVDVTPGSTLVSGKGMTVQPTGPDGQPVGQPVPMEGGFTYTAVLGSGEVGVNPESEIPPVGEADEEEEDTEDEDAEDVRDEETGDEDKAEEEAEDKDEPEERWEETGDEGEAEEIAEVGQVG